MISNWGFYMKSVTTRLLVAMLLFSLLGVMAYGQGGGSTSSLSGVVVDSTGGVIPGADVTVKNDATSAEFKAITAANGTFSIPALNSGIYTATVTVPNFKVAVYKDIRLEAGVPATIRVTLQIGGTSETVIVEAGAEMVQSQTANIAATMVSSQILNLPTGSRSALEAVILSIPGISISGTDTREARVMGLPENMVNITIDGISAQDNYMKSTDGFFSRVRPGVDAMEQVTVSTATPGAESGGGGAVQIRFVTRSGNNELPWRPVRVFAQPVLQCQLVVQQPQHHGARPVKTGGPGSPLLPRPSRISSAAVSAARSGFPSSSTAGTRLSSSSITRNCASRSRSLPPPHSSRPRPSRATFCML